MKIKYKLISEVKFLLIYFVYLLVEAITFFMFNRNDYEKCLLSF